VAKRNDPQGQTGTVVGIHLFVDLELKSGKEKLYGVPSFMLRPVHPFLADRHVVCGAWLGKIEGVRFSFLLVLLFLTQWPLVLAVHL